MLDPAFGHGPGVEDALRLVGRQIALFHDDFPEGPAAGHGFLGYFCPLLVADDGVEGGHQDGVPGQPALRLLAVGGDAHDALVGKGANGADEHVHHLEQVVGDDGHHHVQLQLSRLAGQHHRQVVAHDVERGHVEHLGQDGVHLAGHDAAARLHSRQVDLVQAGGRAAGQQAQVVGDAVQCDSQGAHRGGKVDGVGHALHRLEQIVRLVQRQPGEP